MDVRCAAVAFRPNFSSNADCVVHREVHYWTGYSNIALTLGRPKARLLFVFVVVFHIGCGAGWRVGGGGEDSFRAIVQ